MLALARRLGAVSSIVLTVVLCAPHPGLAAADGNLLYRRNCAACHGAQGHGDGEDAKLFAEPPRDLREVIGAYAVNDLQQRVLDGRRLSLALDPIRMRSQAADVEAVLRHLRRLPAIGWRDVEAGWGLYAQRCETCHGAYGAPPAQLPSGVQASRDLSSREFQESVDDQQLAVAVRHGRNGMPALTPRVSAAEAKQLAAFVRLLSPGFQIYTRYCASCHGDDGRAVGSFGEAMRLPTVVFDRRYLAQKDPEQLRSQAWHMLAEEKPAMPHFRGVLTDAQVRDIVLYLKHARW